MELLNWLRRILRKLLWLLGFVPRIADYISIYIPRENLHPLLADYLEGGIPPGTAEGLFFLGFMASGYLVHRDTINSHTKEVEKLQERFNSQEKDYCQRLEKAKARTRKVETLEPKISVGFQGEEGTSLSLIQINLDPLPVTPDISRGVEQERHRLLPKGGKLDPHDRLGRRVLGGTFAGWELQYKGDVDRYLEEYEQYLHSLHQFSLVKARARFVTPIIENRGGRDASRVEVRFVMPQGYAKPPDGQYSDALIARIDEEYQLKPPPEPKRSILPEAPWEPWTSDDGYALRAEFPPVPVLHASGPAYRERDGVWHIVYSIRELVPGRPCHDLEPFLLYLVDIDELTTWKIPVSVTGVNIPTRIEETLTLEIQITDE